MAWIDAEGVVHSLWIYEPYRFLGPVLSASIESASKDELQSAAESLADIMDSLLDGLGSDLEASSEPLAESGAEQEIPSDLLIEISGTSASLSVEVAETVMQTAAIWRVEVLNAINDVIHDQIDEMRSGD